MGRERGGGKVTLRVEITALEKVNINACNEGPSTGTGRWEL